MRFHHVLLLAPLSAALAGQHVRTHDQHLVWRGAPARSGGASPTNAAAVCATGSPAWHSQPVPGGGSLATIAFGNPASVDRDGALAFYAQVAGAARNQGIFVADAGGLRAVAVGCGQGGGSGNHGSCGDPAPGGGTFAGFFGGTPFVPATNAQGDLLFLADVVAGPSPRGLFLWRADTGTITKIAAVGDPAPHGGTFTAVGPGSINAARECVFLGRNANVTASDVFLWRNGTLSAYAKAGDPAPGGGTFTMLGTEAFGFTDGTNIPTGPVPAINDRGQIAFRALASGPVSRGLVLSQSGVHAWALRAGDPTPVGGTFLDFWAPNLNGVGEIAVLADYSPSTTGWFVGASGSWREVISFFDPIDGGQCLGLAASRNPLAPLDDDGNLAFWVNLSNGGNDDRLAVAAPDGSFTIVARRGGSTPLGGTFGTMDAWPTLSPTGRLSFGAASPGAGNGTILSARFASILCGPRVSAASAAPIGGTLRLDDWGPVGSAFAVFLSTARTNVPLPPFGTLRIGPSPILYLLGPLPYPASEALHTVALPVPNVQALAGATLHFQSLAVQGTTGMLTNATESRLR